MLWIALQRGDLRRVETAYEQGGDRREKRFEWLAGRGATDRTKSYGEEFAMIAAQRQQIQSEDGAPEKSVPRRMLNEKQVLEIVPVGRTTLYRMEKAGRFPKSTYISPNRRVWFEDEIIAWQNAVDEFDPRRRRGKGRRQRVSSSSS
jgi:predicted DNA-binding transcriptional regulator AlpA